MASPQREQGHARIANELMAAFALFGFTARQLRVLFLILLETYGKRGGRKTAPMPVDYIAASCGFDQSHVRRTLRELVEWNVITCAGSKPPILGIQKDYERWSGWPGRPWPEWPKRPAQWAESATKKSGIRSDFEQIPPNQHERILPDQTLSKTSRGAPNTGVGNKGKQEGSKVETGGSPAAVLVHQVESGFGLVASCAQAVRVVNPMAPATLTIAERAALNDYAALDSPADRLVGELAKSAERIQAKRKERKAAGLPDLPRPVMLAIQDAAEAVALGTNAPSSGRKMTALTEEYLRHKALQQEAAGV